MKLSAHAFKTFWSYHAWLGVCSSLILYLMFLAGVVALFRGPLRVWEEPLQHRPASSLSGELQTHLELAVAHSGQSHPKRLLLELPAGDHGTLRMLYSDADGGAWRRSWLDSDRQRFVPEREGVSDFLYQLHYLEIPGAGWLEYLGGALALALLLALTTGVLIHLHNLWRQFYRFRPRSDPRTLSADLHKVTGMFGLPFQALYAYTGAVLVFLPILGELALEPLFAGDPVAAERATWGSAPPPPPAGAPTAVEPLDELVSKATTELPGLEPSAIRVENHGLEHGVVRVYGEVDGQQPFRSAHVVVNQADGQVLHVQGPAHDVSSNRVMRWLSGLHYVYFGGWPTRLALALLTLASCATFLSGNWIWLTRRGAQQPGASFLARVTLGFGGGVPVAMASVLLASRCLPLGWSGRIAAEQAIFAVALLGCLGWALGSSQLRSGWSRQLALAAALFALTPAAAARLSSAGLFGSGPRVSAVVGVDLALLSLAAACAVAAFALRQRTVSPHRQPRPAAPPVPPQASAGYFSRPDTPSSAR